jgi:hypothetical protein
LVAAATGAIVATVIGVYSAGGIVRAADNHPGLAAWVQAFGATAAIGVAIWLQQRTARGVRAAQVEEHNSLIDLCAGLGTIARVRTSEALALLFGLPEGQDAAARTAHVHIVSIWASNLAGVGSSLASVPREDIRDPSLAYHIARLVAAVDTSTIQGFANTHISSARDALNGRKIDIAAAVEGIQARRLKI